MGDLEIYPRFALARLEEALADTPVVLIHGPRQCGKSTLAKAVAKKHGYTYFTFDDENVLRAARADPVGFCAELPERAVLDEVQRIPELFTSIKGLVDRDRRPGRLERTSGLQLHCSTTGPGAAWLGTGGEAGPGTDVKPASAAAAGGPCWEQPTRSWRGALTRGWRRYTGTCYGHQWSPQAES